jgi:lipid II:glycine glycyltransferase (peptidoglycan interpeptide bridge formation enzyme)
MENYFLQTQEWMNFWQDNTNFNHKTYFFRNKLLKAYVQEYPWQLKEKFWYIAKGPVIDRLNIDDKPNKEELKNSLEEILNEIAKEAEKQNINYLKIDLDDTVTNILEINNNDEALTFLKSLNINEVKKVKISSKKIQYLQCTVNSVDCDFDSNSLSINEFYDQSQSFWSKANERVRRYSRKILKKVQTKELTVDTDKTIENFNLFWQIHKETSIRQNFPTQTKEYLQNMCFSSFGRLIIIKDEQNQAQVVWLGIALNNTLYYLLGGNSQESLKNHYQYLIQIMAVKICYDEKLHFYDMGGYDALSGYGQFKDGYRGKMRTFFGPFDLILKPIKYDFINTISNGAKLIKKIT